MRTIVVNINHGADFDVYVGRAGRGFDGYFGNPFPLGRLAGPGERQVAIAKFREYFYRRLKTDLEFMRRVHELKGKRLGCFCVPQPCHADVIAQYLESLP